MGVDAEGREWADAETDAGWLRPVPGPGRREPRWGHPDGLQLGLHPLSGPRGLLRIYTPYLGHPRDRLVNFIAVEPIPSGAVERGYSELERSRLDDVPGLRFWSSDEPGGQHPSFSDEPARGVVWTGDDGIERLTVQVGVEPFANGADVWVTVEFRADRPHEVSVAASAHDSSVALDACVLSATMGNWSRLRRLELADGAVSAAELWPDYRGSAFAEHASFPLERLRRDGDEVVVSATPDEDDPAVAVYAEGTKEHWHYEGVRGVQTWRAGAPDPHLAAQVNGRHTYWMSEHAIPGGIAFENVEILEPFRQGRALVFQIEPMDA
ncbi:MAG: hypothetical protein ABWY55_12495 [Microbacterium sp.]